MTAQKVGVGRQFGVWWADGVDAGARAYGLVGAAFKGASLKNWDASGRVG